METISFSPFVIGSVIILLIALIIYLIFYIKLTFFTKNVTEKQEEWKDRIGLWLIVIWCIAIFIYYVVTHD